MLLVDWSVGLFVCWLVDRSVGRSVGRFVGSLVGSFARSFVVNLVHKWKGRFGIPHYNI